MMQYLTTAGLRSAVNAAANTDGASHIINFSGPTGIIDLYGWMVVLNIRDVSADDGPGSNFDNKRKHSLIQ